MAGVVWTTATTGVAWIGTILGVAVMFVGAAGADGEALVFVLGLGHSVAFTASTLILWVYVARRVGASLVPRELPLVVGASLILGIVGWAALRLVDPTGPTQSTVTALALGAAGVLAYYGVLLAVVAVRRVPS